LRMKGMAWAGKSPRMVGRKRGGRMAERRLRKGIVWRWWYVYSERRAGGGQHWKVIVDELSLQKGGVWRGVFWRRGIC
jgi:hypothetical protein